MIVAPAPAFGQRFFKLVGPPAGVSPAAHYRKRFVAARINGVAYAKPAVILQAADGQLLVARGVFARWRLAVRPDMAVTRHAGTDYYNLDDLPGATHSIQATTQTLVVHTPAANLLPTVIDAQPRALPTPEPGPAGGFFNYDFVYQRNDDDSNIANATLEAGVFNDLGVGTTRFLVHGLDAGNQAVRLNSTWRYDWPDKRQTLRLGDALSRSGAWGRSVQFGGIQWGTNFATQPGFVTFPQPDLASETTVPGTVELYANGLKRAQRAVDAGPFSIRDAPVATGANDLQLVVHDALGRARVITRSFYASPDLLKQGLSDFGYAAGFVRRDFARQSNDYGDGFISGLQRIGLTDTTTIGTRMQIMRGQQTAGVSATTAILPALGVVSGALATSNRDGDRGGLANLGIQRQGRRLSYGVQTTWASAGFRELGLRPGLSLPKFETLAHAGAALGANSAVSASFLALDRRDGPDSSFINANFSTGLFEGLGLSAYASHRLQTGATTLGVTLTAALGGRTSASLGHRHGQDSDSSRLDIQRSLARGNRVGYRLAAEHIDQGQDRRRGELAARSRYARFSAQVAQLGAATAYRASATGGAAFLGGDMFVTRRITDSFGVVKVGDYPGVDVYQDNQKVARTNDDGEAFVPDMRAFERNRISFAQQALPLSARVGQQEKIAIPAWRHGVVVDFDIGASKGALIQAIRPNGDPIPAGATVGIDGHKKRFPVASNGRAWVTGLAPTNHLVAQWPNHRCDFEARLPAKAGPTPRLGPFICRPRRRAVSR